MNKCVFSGNMAADPETRQVKDGVSVTDFRLAVNNPRKEGEVLWLTCVAWNRDGKGVGEKLIQPFAKKGSLVAVSGRLSVEEFEGKDGTNRTKLKVELDDNGFEFVGSKKKDDAEPVKEAEADKKPSPAGKKNGTIDLGKDGKIPF